MIKDCRLWKSLSNDVDEILSYDNKYKNYTHVKIDANPLNCTAELSAMKLEEANIADGDIVIVELPKPGQDKDWTF